MSSKHTPGPWVIQRYVGSDAFQVHAWGRESNGWQPKPLPVAWIPNGWYRGDGALHNELEANAPLIAAAPDLLEALKAMVALDEEHHQRCQGDEDVCREVRHARYAIAKAIGDTK